MLKKHLVQFVLIACFCLYSARPEYISYDEPECSEDCLSLNETMKSECLNQMMEFYSYKLIKSVFNYGKTAIYAGLWATRNENPDLDLFETVFNETLKEYDNADLLGVLSFEDLSITSNLIFETLRNYSLQRDLTLSASSSKYSIPYASIPSLQCPILCSYDILTWQTLFYISLSIFILALITISLYTIFLRKQYLSLKNRLKKIKYTKVADTCH